MTTLSVSLDRTSVIEIGRNSASVEGFDTFGIGSMHDVFYWDGTSDWAIEAFKSTTSG